VYSRGGSPSLAREGPSQLISLSKVPTSRVLIIYLQLRISRGASALCHADVYLLLSHYCLLRSSPSSASPLSATFAYIPSGHRPREDPDCSGGLLRRLFGSITDSPPRRTRGSRQRAFSVPLPLACARLSLLPSFCFRLLFFRCLSFSPSSPRVSPSLSLSLSLSLSPSLSLSLSSSPAILSAIRLLSSCLLFLLAPLALPLLPLLPPSPSREPYLA